MFDYSLEESEAETDSRLTVPKLDKKPPLVQLAVVMQTGMEAIATARTTRKDSPGQLQEVHEKINAQHTESMRMQQRQVKILELIASKFMKD
ncbi:hypothetical protein GN244_ATG15611 [Phytophthora infestans]|nr:hypothetical protein GN244_ATG15611 [Phytophthora infestans]